MAKTGTIESRGSPLTRGRKTAERVARAILDDISNASLQPGDALPPESSMLQQLRVGRATLREALRILEIHGLISIKPGPGGGPTVEQAKSESFGRMATLYFHRLDMKLSDLITARLALEPFMARSAAERKDHAELDLLSELIDEMNALDVTDSRLFLDTAERFHRAVSQLSGNPVLDFFANALADTFHARIRGNEVQSHDRRLEIVRVHKMIAEAVLAGEAGLTEELMRSHMKDYAESVSRGNQGLLNETIDWD